MISPSTLSAFSVAPSQTRPAGPSGPRQYARAPASPPAPNAMPRPQVPTASGKAPQQPLVLPRGSLIDLSA